MREYKITCPHCQETLAILGTQLDKVISCDSCGRSIRAPSLPELARQSGGHQSGGTKLCPFCSESIQATARKCKHCGEFLSERQAISSNQKVKKASIRIPWLLFWAGLGFTAIDKMYQQSRDITEDPMIRVCGNYHEIGMVFFLVAALAAIVPICKGRVTGGLVVLILSLLFFASNLHEMGVI